MRSPLILPTVCVVLCSSVAFPQEPGAPAVELLFAGGAVASSVAGELVILDSTTFASSPLGAGSAGGAISGLACTSRNGVWAAAAGGADVLWKINPDTGAVNSTVPLTLSTGGSVGNIGDLAVQPGTDTLFATGGYYNSMLYSIDKSSGVMTPVGDTGGGQGGLAFAADGTLFGGHNDLYTLDPSTGAVLSSVALTPHNGIHGLAVRPSDGALIGAMGGWSSDYDLVVRINPVTGQTAALGVTGDGAMGDLDYLIPPSAACALRQGILGLNPSDYSCVTDPILGETWSSSISMTPTAGTVAVSSFIALGLGGPVAGVPLFGHELLILPGFLPVGPALGSHNIPIPYMLSGAGVTIASQGARIEGGPGGLEIVLTNGQDLSLGL